MTINKVKKGLLEDLYEFRQSLIEKYPINIHTDKDVERLLLKVNDEILFLEDLVEDFEESCE